MDSFIDALHYLGTLPNRSKDVNFFGFGLERHSEMLSSFFSDYKENFIFTKEKQVKHISKAINKLMELEQPYFYTFTDSVPMTHLERIPQSKDNFLFK